MMNQDMQAANQVLNNLLKRFPKHPEVCAAQAELLMRDGKFDEALDVYETVLRDLPKGVIKPAILVGKGTLFLIRENMAECTKALEKAIELDPNFDQAYEILYRAKIQTGDLQGAIGALEREAKMLISGSWFDIQKINEVLAPKQVIFEIRSPTNVKFFIAKHEFWSSKTLIVAVLANFLKANRYIA